MDINQDRVLIVDDDRDSRHLFEGHLAGMGYATVTAKDGEDALDILSQDPYFDLIITDVMMPYMTGFDFTTRLKELSSTRHIPVIATSAFYDWEKARKNRELIADGFVSKPIEKNALLTEIQRIMRMKETGRASEDTHR
jgi:CheY-like chemotaxis protein